MTDCFAWGLGVGTQNRRGEWLEVFFPTLQLHPDAPPAELAALFAAGGSRWRALDGAALQRLAAAGGPLGQLASRLAESQRPVVAVWLNEDLPPGSVPEAYLKLQLLSHRLVKPHALNLNGLFGVLKNVAWTNEGAIDVEELAERQLKARLAGRTLQVHSVDKFPAMADYVVPGGVRIADAARVRLGAYLGEGTTIMHEGFVNFNAGTLGTSMVEGRISAGVTVGAGSDLGGGSSTMGTLSGGGSIVISLGKECLLGANAGTGIPLGDRCTIEAGLYITAGTKVALLDETGAVVEHVKARELAGQDNLLFRRNSVTGAVECKTNRSAVALNAMLHSHN